MIEMIKSFLGKKTSLKMSDTQSSLMERYGRSLPSLNKRDVLRYFNANPMLHTCASKIAESISITDWELYRLNKKGEREKISSHGVLSLIKTFNPLFSTGIDGWYTVQLHLEIVGNAFLHKERDDLGRPIYLWTYNPNDVYELPSKSNGFNYSVKIGNLIHKIPMTEIVHIKNVNPSDPYGFGIGIAETLTGELQISEYASKQVGQYFFNGAVPPYIIGAEVNPDQLKAMKDSWTTENQGWFNRNKPYFTNTTNIDVKRLTDSFKDMTLVDLMKDTSEIIRKSFGIPPEIIGEVTNSNRATIQGAREIYALEVLVPRLKKIRDVIQTNILTDFEDNLILDFTSPVPSDNELTLRVIKEFKQAFKLNEIRSFVDFEEDSSLKEKYGEAESSQDKYKHEYERRHNLDGSRIE